MSHYYKNDKPVSSFEEAQNIILNSVDPLSYENIPIIDAFGRILYEDIKGIVLWKGERLEADAIGMLSSLNYNTVKVYKQPVVSIISTGSELAEVGGKIKPGQIRNSNAYTLCSEVKKYNAIPNYLGIAKDTYKDTKDKFLKALKSDVIISTGGASMGKYDFVKKIYSDLNIEIPPEWKNVKPGNSCIFGKKYNKLFFGLPGNPVSTLTSFIQFVRPALLKLMGAKRLKKPIVNAFTEKDIDRPLREVHLLLRGHFTIRNNEFYVKAANMQKSSALYSMSIANCLIIIPEYKSKIRAGEKVAIQLIEHDEI